MIMAAFYRVFFFLSIEGGISFLVLSVFGFLGILYQRGGWERVFISGFDINDRFIRILNIYWFFKKYLFFVNQRIIKEIQIYYKECRKFRKLKILLYNLVIVIVIWNSLFQFFFYEIKCAYIYIVKIGIRFYILFYM